MAINTFTVHFVLKEEKVNKHGMAPIYAKLRINGSKVELSTNRTIDPILWITDKVKAKPENAELIQFNGHIDHFRTKLYTTSSKVLLQTEKITALNFKDALAGKKVIVAKVYSLIEVTTEHNLEFEKQVGKKYSYGSYKNYKTTLNTLKNLSPFI